MSIKSRRRALGFLLLLLLLLLLWSLYYYYTIHCLREEHATEAAAHLLDRTAQARLSEHARSKYKHVRKHGASPTKCSSPAAQ